MSALLGYLKRNSLRVTPQFLPKGKALLFARMEEDVDDSGIARASRFYDAAGKTIMTARTQKFRAIGGVFIPEESEIVNFLPEGKVIARTILRDIILDLQP